MRVTMRTGVRLTALAALVAAAAACGTHRKLRITEVGAGVVELYLDEPTDHVIDLSRMEFAVAVSDPMAGPPTVTRFDLVGELRGGEFVVVFEEAGNTTGPGAASYTNFFGNSVNGISVPVGSLGIVDPARSYAMRVQGEYTISAFPFWVKHSADDVVTFGPRPRPTLGGTFTENGTRDTVERTVAVGLTRGRTIRRRVVSGVPQDTDSEADWRGDDEGFGQLE
jgi:hypothetical protein